MGSAQWARPEPDSPRSSSAYKSNSELPFACVQYVVSSTEAVSLHYFFLLYSVSHRPLAYRCLSRMSASSSHVSSSVPSFSTNLMTTDLRREALGGFFFSHPCLRSSPFLILAFPLFHDLVHISEIDSVDVLLRSRGPSPVY